LIICAICALIGLWQAPAHAGDEALAEGAERVLFSFEKGCQGWEIPEWAANNADFIARSAKISKEVTRSGKSSLKVAVHFTGKHGTAAVVEDFEYFNWTPYREVLCDIYAPKNAPHGLKAKIVLTIGKSWKRVEMSRFVELDPGHWVTVSANLLPGSKDWTMTMVREHFRKDVRKIAVKVESDKPYSGAVYIDNVRVVIQ
jgi:hypothetical protein